MIDRLHDTLSRLSQRLMSHWVKPAVLPADPDKLINPELPILYVLEFGGLADRTALQLACTRHGLPAPGDRLVFGPLTENSSIDILKQRQGTVFRPYRHLLSRRLSRIVAAGLEEGAGELQIVPVAVYWGQAPEKESSVWRLWFTENWHFAGRSRKFMTTLLHGRNTLLSISEPLSFATLRSSGEPPEVLERKLSRILRVHFRQRRIATLGPDQSHRRMLIDHVLADATVRQAIITEAAGKSPARARRQAEKYAFEIAADVSYPTVRILNKLLTRLWNELYDGVEIHGLERLKSVADGHELVYVPCHRSHIDYLLLSYILYRHGYALPHIAAGINLNLPMVGGLLRRGGAFFLRRSFAGKPLYTAVFNGYLKEILQRGHALEYFVEGGRSRTGRLLPPKGGMLAMTVHAYLQKPRTPVVFVPVYLGYERLLEGRAFTSELSGGKKQKETVLALLRSLRSLKEDYGHVYVNFGEPIPLTKLLDSHQSNWQNQPASHDRPDWLKPVVHELGNRIMQNINEAACVTPVSLLATTMLATARGRISQEELVQQMDMYQQLIRSAHAHALVEVPDINASQLIEHGIRLGFIENHADSLGPIIQVRDGQMAPLLYFRNNILHLLTLPALIAAAFTNTGTRDDGQLRKLLSLTFPFLQGELFLPTELPRPVIDGSLSALENAGLMQFRNGVWHRAPAGSLQAVSLMRLAQVVMPALERHYLCASLLARAPEGQLSGAELAKRNLLGAERLAGTHGGQVSELFDKHSHVIFVDGLIRHGYVHLEDGMLVPQACMLEVEREARSLLGEQTRHAIINAALAASNVA
ncbi:glycerol-3-phosphate 1-O-acyltransferase PlsB [Granulosicoccus sp. 3-233]|uniref:glycerol-3-phosphate 1-O-acyltransferase PlsB n=1 Tax=Granulosicoccus sp. 3-233 TaxID=3417969 RepID=UPI003D32F7B4